MHALEDGNFGFFIGDLNQDGDIDIQDLNLFSSAAVDFTIGYTIYDITGDHFPESGDFSLLENNLGQFLIRP